jgi:hypothetical protein
VFRWPGALDDLIPREKGVGIDAIWARAGSIRRRPALKLVSAFLTDRPSGLQHRYARTQSVAPADRPGGQLPESVSFFTRSEMDFYIATRIMACYHIFVISRFSDN